MKPSHLLLFLAGPLAAVAQPQRSPAKVTLLRVEAHAFGEQQYVTVNADLVVVTKVLNTEDGHDRTHYARALTPQEHDALLAPFNRVYLSALQPDYEGRNALTDDVVFGLFIHKGAVVKHIRIYRYKLAPFYAFSTKLSQLVPPAFQLDYTERYFTN